MSRMFKPEMEAVHFTEEDIITASGAGVFTTTHFGNRADQDQVKGDGIIEYLGQTYNSSNYLDFMTALSNNGISNQTSMIFGNTPLPVDAVMNREFGASTYKLSTAANGTWTYDVSANVFRRQS